MNAALGIFVCIAAYVVDGDTFDCSLAGWEKVRIRLHALHAPERGDDGGTAATEALRNIIRPNGRRAFVWCQEIERDRYGRIVADCETWQGDVALAMIASGTARHCPRYGRPDLEGTPDNDLSLPPYCIERDT